MHTGPPPHPARPHAPRPATTTQPPLPPHPSPSPPRGRSDVKGANVLVTRDGVVKLADFGASKATRGSQRTDVMKSMRGSVFWMAPEVIKGTGYGVCFSRGVVVSGCECGG